MIQFNLLPDVKLNYVKTTRLKRTISAIAGLLAGVALLIMLLLYVSVYFVQKSHIHSLNSQISSATTSLEATPNLNKVLTVQDAVNALPALNKSKPVASRIAEYMSEVTPTNVTLSNLNVSFVTNTMTLTGQANSLADVNLFVDTLKQANYQVNSNSTSLPAFPSVVLTSATYTNSTTSTNSSNQSNASFGISITFDEALFAQGNDQLILNVPSNAAARGSSSNSALFVTPPTSQKSGSTTN